MFALTRSLDKTRGGMQFGQEAFSFAREALAGFAFAMSELEGGYVLRVLFAPSLPGQPLRRATLVVPVPASVETSLDLLAFAIQLAGFFETPLEYADRSGDQSHRVKN